MLVAGICFAPFALAQIAVPEANSDATNIYYRSPFSGTPAWVRTFVDQDRNATTGYRFGGVGAGYLVENGKLYRYAGTGTNWAWTFMKQVSYTAMSGWTNITLARADLGSPSGVDLITNTDPPSQTSAKVSLDLAVGTFQATSDATNVNYKIPYSGTPTWVRIFLDKDRNATTGFSFNGVGAEYLVENGNLFRYSGTGGANWNWTLVKTVGYTSANGMASVTIARVDLGSPLGIDLVTQTDPPIKTSSKITQTLATTATPSPTPSPTPTPTPTPTPIPTPTTSAEGRIEFYGDSTALGGVGGTAYIVAQTPSMVIDENLPTGFTVINEGVNGASIAELLAGTDGKHAPWRTVMSTSSAKYIILNHAINDSYEPGNTPAIYKAKYAQVVDIALAAGKKIFIETANPTNNDGQTNPYNEAAKQLAAEKGLPVIDQYAYLKQYMATSGLGIYNLTNDGVHPTQATYILKGQYAARRIKQVLGIP